MRRLPALNAEGLSDPARAVWDQVAGGRPTPSVDGDGGLLGPFNAWVHAPGIGRPLLEAGSVLLSATTLDRRLVELAIITTGAHWRAEFEWWAHARMAERHGVPADVIEAIGDGRDPGLSDETDRAVHQVARELASTGRLADPTYQQAHALLGDTALVELVTICGYYTLISFTLNAFAVGLPTGAVPRWE